MMPTSVILSEVAQKNWNSCYILFLLFKTTKRIDIFYLWEGHSQKAIHCPRFGCVREISGGLLVIFTGSLDAKPFQICTMAGVALFREIADCIFLFKNVFDVNTWKASKWMFRFVENKTYPPNCQGISNALTPIYQISK